MAKLASLVPARNLLLRVAAASRATFRFASSLWRQSGSWICFWIERFVAKWIYHDSQRYGTLLGRVHHSSGIALGDHVRKIRRLDNQGLGLWLLALTNRSESLTQRCTRSLRGIRSHTDRRLIHLIEKALQGEAVEWNRTRSDTTHALLDVLLASSATLAFTAMHMMTGTPGKLWLNAYQALSASSQSLATLSNAADLPDHVRGKVRQSQTLSFQALNMTRRAINGTTLHGDEYLLRRDSVRLCLAAVRHSCLAGSSAAQSGTPSTPSQTGSAAPLQMFRSIDALAGRVELVLRKDLDDNDKAVAPIRQRLAQSLRPFIDLADSTPSCQLSLCGDRTRSAAMLVAEGSDAEQPVLPGGARWTVGDVQESLRELASSDRPALRSIACLAMIDHASPALERSLWQTIRGRQSSQTERWLAFDLFCRLNSPKT